MVKRAIMAEVRRCAREFPVVTVFGPRQSGKSTLARLCFPDMGLNRSSLCYR